MKVQEIFEEIGLQELRLSPGEIMYDDEENEKLNTYVSFNKAHFYGDNRSKPRDEIEIFFYPDEGIDFDKFIVAVKKKMKEIEVVR